MLMTRKDLQRLHALQELQREINAEGAALLRLQKCAKAIGFTATLTATSSLILRGTGRTIHCTDATEAWHRLALLTKGA